LRLELPRALAEAMAAAAEAAYPEECCGLLLGHPLPEGAGWTISAWQPAANIHPEPKRHFELDPQTHIALLRRLRAAGEGGEQLIGHLHSHPDAAARPSATDQAMAFDPTLLWLIVAVPAGQAQPPTAWRIAAGGHFTSVRLSICEDIAPAAKKP
jgi:proteasome lid subunit RPN8/RPN11